MIDESKLFNDVLDYIKRRPTTSFAELAREWPEHFKDGEWAMEFRGEKHSNIFMWFSCSDAACDIFDEFQKHKHVQMDVASPLTYMIDGAMPNVPLAKSKRHYKTQRWLPVVFTARPLSA